MLPGDSVELRKQRGAFFTPYPIAEFLASWAFAGRKHGATILDPTSGEAVFLLAASQRAQQLDVPVSLFGVDLHVESIRESARLLDAAGSKDHTLFQGDFFDEIPPSQIGGRIPYVDAVVGNPPFIRYQEHRGLTRHKAAAAALAQGVRLSGLASSWAPLLVHAASFLKPDGKLAMVVPAELLSVGYAEPIRAWLRSRFRDVRLVLFNRLQFSDAEEQVVLLVAEGTGGCDSFTLYEVDGADELSGLHPLDAQSVVPRSAGKWTDLLVPDTVRSILNSAGSEHFAPLSDYGRVELGTVTGANRFFTLSEATRREYELQPEKHVIKTAPPGSRHIGGTTFTSAQWEQLKVKGERVWMLYPASGNPTAKGFLRYKELGEKLGVPAGYKCSIRGEQWWRPPAQSAPHMFFTYMNHASPRLVANAAGVTLVNSMHGLTFGAGVDRSEVQEPLSLLSLNTFTRLSAELTGRAYGGGVLKLEPREAAALLVPEPAALKSAWEELRADRSGLDDLVRTKRLEKVTDRVDQVLLRNTLGLSESDIQELTNELRRQRGRRQRREQDDGSEEGRRL